MAIPRAFRVTISYREMSFKLDGGARGEDDAAIGGD